MNKGFEIEDTEKTALQTIWIKRQTADSAYIDDITDSIDRQIVQTVKTVHLPTTC